MSETFRFGRYTVELSRPDKVLFPEDGITKRDLAHYYRTVGQAMIRHVHERPLMMHRFPDGIGEEGFYQKNVSEHFPEWIRTIEVRKEGGRVTHVLCENVATLVYLADQATITPHVWLSRVGDLEHPDLLNVDLDPDGDPSEDAGALETLRLAARALRELVDAVGLVPFVMTTGSRGLHVVTPLDGSATFDEVRAFARALAEHVAERHPDRFTTAARKDARGGRLFLDVGRNAYAQTAVAPYAVRPRPGAPVAMPLDWARIDDSRFHPRRYTIANVCRAMGRSGDAWKGMRRHARALDGPAGALERLARR